MRAPTSRLPGWITGSALAAIAAAPAWAEARDDVAIGTLPRAQGPSGPASAGVDVARSVFLEARLGRKAVVRDALGVELGTIRDHVVERLGGSVRFVVVEPAGVGAGRSRLVPWERFSFDAESRELTLALGRDALAKLPVFERAKLQTLGPAEVLAGGEAREAGAPEREPRNVLASELIGAKVAGQRDAFGKLGELVLEPRRGRIAFAIVNDGSARESESGILVPWQALVFAEEGRWVIPMTVEALQDAPRFALDELGMLERRETLDAVLRFYKIPTPVHSSEPLGSTVKAGRTGRG